MTKADKAALDGVTVLDLTQFESGTVCTETLAWLGAEVIKVERPGTGEQGRSSSTDKEGTDAYTFIIVNANKKSVTINLKDDRGKEIIKQLVEDVDVFVENFSPGVIERLGLGYEVLREINPRLIYAQMKGFGPDGPYGDYPAFDPIGQATGGAASVTGESDGPPLHAGVNLADSGTGLHCVVGILAALYQRTVTGEGQRIELAMQDVVISLGRSSWGRQLTTGKPAERVGNGMPMAPVAPCDVYPCRPGGRNDYVHIYTSRWPGSPQWRRLLEVIGRTDLLEDPRFADPESRYEHKEEVNSIISAWTQSKTKVEAMEELGKAGVPAGAVFDTLELSEDPYLRKRGTFVVMEHPVRGDIVIPGFPIKMSASSVPVYPSPALGEHNEEVYMDRLGMSREELNSLEADNLI